MLVSMLFDTFEFEQQLARKNLQTLNIITSIDQKSAGINNYVTCRANKCEIQWVEKQNNILMSNVIRKFNLQCNMISIT